MKKIVSSLLLGVVVLCVASNAFAQATQILFGDVRVTADNSNVVVPQEVLLILRRVPDGEVGRQMVSSRGRYRFSNLKTGDYEIVVEVDGKEIGRLQQITVGGLSNSPYGFQYDLEFKFKAPVTPKSGVISAADVYPRPDVAQQLFNKAEGAVEKKKFDQAAVFLKQILDSDPGDFQAFTVLGSVYVAQEKFNDAEKAYQQSIKLKPASARASLNLGRLWSNEKKFAEAIEPLTHVVELQPDSGDAQMLLGECYLQIKKGSLAIPHLDEAAKLGHPEAHLRLGWLYNAAGLKDRAAIEYEEFLKKKPDYSDRAKLKEYIQANRKTQ
ncbi:MAG TPA: tetratricopeptide repeat protein [Pyrinomonadaceae bacterium]